MLEGTLGAAFRTRRWSRGLDQKQAAEEIGVSVKTYAGWETNCQEFVPFYPRCEEELESQGGVRADVSLASSRRLPQLAYEVAQTMLNRLQRSHLRVEPPERHEVDRPLPA